MPGIKAVFVGVPKTLLDTQGSWQSSIHRERFDSPVAVSLRGLEGDRVAQPYHGGPDAALCVHLTDHYRFWNEAYGMTLGPGDVGENLTLSGVTEDEVCVGDVIGCGSALAQVSGPRVPCVNLARRIGRGDWVKLTIRENRTGFYMRVLEPGVVAAEAPWVLKDRINEQASIPEMNQCMYLEFDPLYAARMLQMKGLGTWWREQAVEKLQRREMHWTSRLREEVKLKIS